MDDKQEILEAIDILIQAAAKNSTKIYTCVVKHSTASKCTVVFNGEEHTVKFYGNQPKDNVAYPLFVPQGNLSLAFIIV